MSAFLPPIAAKGFGSAAADSRKGSIASLGNFYPVKPPSPPPRQQRPSTATSAASARPSVARPPAGTQSGRYVRRERLDSEPEGPSLGSRVYLSRKQDELLAMGHESELGENEDNGEEIASPNAKKRPRRNNPNVTSVQRLFQLAGVGALPSSTEEAAPVAATAAKRISLSSSFLSQVFSVDDFRKVSALQQQYIVAAQGNDLWETAVAEKKAMWTQALYYLSLLNEERELYAQEKKERLQLLGQFISCQYPQPCRCLRWDMEVLEQSAIPLEPAVNLTCLFVSLVLSECASFLHETLLRAFLQERQLLFETFKLEAIMFGVMTRLQKDEDTHWSHLLHYHEYAMTRAALQGEPVAVQWQQQQQREKDAHIASSDSAAPSPTASDGSSRQPLAPILQHKEDATRLSVPSALVVSTAKTGALILPPTDFVSVHLRAARAYVGDYDSPFCTQLQYLDFRILVEAEQLRRIQIEQEEVVEDVRCRWYYNNYTVVANLLIQWELSRRHLVAEEQKAQLHLADCEYATRTSAKAMQKAREEREGVEQVQQKEIFEFLMCALHAQEQYSEMYLQELQTIHTNIHLAVRQAQLQQDMVDLAAREQKDRAVLEGVERTAQTQLQLITGWASRTWLPALQRLYLEEMVAWVMLTRVVLAEDWERAQVEELWSGEHKVLFAAGEDDVDDHSTLRRSSENDGSDRLPLRNVVISDLYTFMEDKELISLFS